jgi:type I restriction enzyme S subunit
MNGQDIKNSILQLAIQGKLIEQRKNEGTAKELLEAIKIEKEKLIKQGKIKKDTPLPEISEDEIPFGIPENWEWIRLGDVLEIARGGSPRPIKSFLTDSDDGINWIKIGDTDKGGKYINQTNEKIIKEGLKKSRYVRKGDFLLSNSMSFGRPYILNIDGCIHDGWLVLSQYIDIFNKEYLYYLLSSRMVFNQFSSRVSGAVVNNLNSDKVKLTLVPLPPLEEQKRIVAKIDELMPYVEDYDKAHSKVEELNKKFPEDMQKSILQYAIQGKLVEQQKEEGTAKQLVKLFKQEKEVLIKEGKLKNDKPLPDITEDEIPFDIPENWEWVRLGDCVSHKSGVSYKKDNLGVSSNKMIRILRGGNISDLEYSLKNDDVMLDYSFVKDELLLKKNTLITPAVTSLEHIGKIARIEKDYIDVAVGGFVLMLIPNINNDIISQYLLIALSSPYHRSVCRSITNKSGQAFYNLSREKLMNVLLPLPPLDEQKRIVAKVDELLPFCSQLVK